MDEADTQLDSILVEEIEEGQRLDQFLVQKFENKFSRTYFQALIADQMILINEAPAKKRICVKRGDEISIVWRLETGLSDLVPEPIPLTILYEDNDILVVNKPPGMVVHPAPGHVTGTFVHALLFYCQNLIGSDPCRPGIVHRLDKDTSGVLLAAKHREAQYALSELFKSRSIHKEYLAVCAGHPEDMTIDKAIGRDPIHRKRMMVRSDGRHARSHITVLGRNKEASGLRVVIETGRTHQIRVHLQSIGCPILGDPLYGHPNQNKKIKATRTLLHASMVHFVQPFSGQQIKVMAPIPEDIHEWFQNLAIVL